MPDALLEVDRLDAFYGDFQALFRVSLTAQAGAVTALIGANGAGKSTLLKSVAGLMPARADAIRFTREPVGHLPAHALVARGIALVPEGRRLFPSLSVEENLLIGGQLRRPGPCNLARVYDLFPILSERRALPSTALSGGQQQMCAIGRALMSGPKLLLLDEPSAGLAPVVVQAIFELVRKICAEGYTVLIVEQNIRQVLKVVERAYLLEAGKIVLSGRAEELLNSKDIQKAYLGL
jgi:branched-chain amino acid transport system ATP-binding protein